MNTSNKYRVTVRLELPRSAETLTACYDVEDETAPSWGPVDICDRGITAMITGGITEEMQQQVRGERKMLADYIARGISEALMKAIESRDTRNGYAKH